jgi:LuxR family maltose regulon positive regulatory protein
LQQAADLCAQQSLLAQRNGLSRAAIGGWLMAIWGEILAEQNQLAEAVDRAKQGAQLTRHGRDLAMIGWSNLCLIRVLFSVGDMAGVEATIREMEALVRRNVVPPWITRRLLAWRVRIWLATGALEAAAHLVDDNGLLIDGRPTYVNELVYVALVRVRIAQDRLDETLPLIERLIDSAEVGGRISVLLEVLLLKAVALQAMGARDQALAAMQRALSVAKRYGYVRALVDEGQPVERLLQQMVAQGISSGYARHVLAAFAVDEPAEADQSDLVEPLSERELEVLQLIAQGLTNREIAARLYLSLNTIKVHTRNIYGKLSAHNRTQAVSRARDLGVLPSG